MANEKAPQPGADAPRADSLGGMARRLADPSHLASLWRRGAATLREQGAEQLWRDVRFRVALAAHHDLWQHRADLPTRRMLAAQRQAPPAAAPQISILVPLYNTPAYCLRAMLASVRRQSYPNWQLCLADASDAAHGAVERTCRAAAGGDARIRYVHLPENRGIAGNTNAALALATGAYLTLLDHDDLLYPNALYEMEALLRRTGAEMAYSDEIVLSDDLRALRGYHFKPGYAPDYLNNCNYITHLCVFSRALLERAGGGEDPACDGAQDYDLILRLTEQLSGPEGIAHLPKVLYTWRAARGSTAENLVEAKPYAIEAGRRALAGHLARLGRAASVEALPQAPGAYRVRYALTAQPLVSVLIPSCDHADDLDRCLASLYAHAGYDNFEVLVAENNSRQAVTEAYYHALPKKYPRCRVVRYSGGFNFSAINNFARRQAAGEYLLLLNNDIRILSDGFLAEMLSYAQRPDVGAVGARLYYPDDTIQHGGVLLGINGSAGHSHKGRARDSVGDLYRLVTAQDYLAVTGACLLVRAALYDACGGLDEGDFAVAYNDIDFCLKLHEKGLLNVWTPWAEAYHCESKSRGADTDGANAARYAREKAAFQARWGAYLPEGADPYYNIHFTQKFENFGLK